MCSLFYLINYKHINLNLIINRVLQFFFFFLKQFVEEKSQFSLAYFMLNSNSTTEIFCNVSAKSQIWNSGQKSLEICTIQILISKISIRIFSVKNIVGQNLESQQHSRHSLVGCVLAYLQRHKERVQNPKKLFESK